MAKSDKFDLVKNYFDNKLWNINRVYNAVNKKWITEEEYNEITGCEYPSKEVVE